MEIQKKYKDNLGTEQIEKIEKYLEVTKITEANDEDIRVKDALENLIVDTEYLLKSVRELKEITDEEKDYATSAELDNHVTEYEKLLWMMKSYIK